MSPSRAFPVVAAVVVLMAAGLARRQAVDDAGNAAALKQAVEGLPAMLPVSAGDWLGREVVFDRRGLDRAGIAALVATRYRNVKTGDLVTAVVLCGRPGPIAAHGPEACYPEVGFKAVSAPERVRLQTAEFWSAEFQGGELSERHAIRVLWAWADGDAAWSAPESPRLKFAAARVLYKLYLLDEPGQETSTAPALDLAAAVLPRIDVRRPPTVQTSR